jgi:hypothetical protein
MCRSVRPAGHAESLTDCFTMSRTPPMLQVLQGAAGTAQWRSVLSLSAGSMST